MIFQENPQFFFQRFQNPSKVSIFYLISSAPSTLLKFCRHKIPHILPDMNSLDSSYLFTLWQNRTYLAQLVST